MIPKHEKAKAGASFLSKTYYDITTKDTCFQAGVQFAEDYLKDLSIEFGDYITEYNSTPHLNRIEDTQELFEQFIKEKYESNPRD